MANQKMCQQCGTLIDANDPSGLCAGCGKSAAGYEERDGQHHIAPPLVHDDEPHGAEPMETFPTAPAGTSGETNPELKVRR